MAQPSARQLISPSQTGTSGAAPTKAVQTSVPPETDCSWTDGSNASYTQRKPSAGSGAPVDPMPRSAPRSARLAGARPSLRQAIRNGALVPKKVTRSSPAMRHSAPRSGWPGLPS